MQHGAAGKKERKGKKNLRTTSKHTRPSPTIICHSITDMSHSKPHLGNLAFPAPDAMAQRRKEGSKEGGEVVARVMTPSHPHSPRAT